MIISYTNSFYFLIVWALLIAGPQTYSNTFFDVATTPDTGVSQTPVGTSGTQTQTITPTETPTVTPTTTLMPLPAITLNFPAHPSTPEITQKPTLALATSTQISDSENIFDSDFPRVRVIIIVLAVLWMILACFLIIYIRQFR
jgi:hypothetical protein